eukprot:gene5544-6905_t
MVFQQPSNQFQEDFKKYLKKIQPPLSRIIITFIITAVLISYGEIAFYQSTDKLSILSCAQIYENGTKSTSSIDVCFAGNISYCAIEKYNPGQPSSLVFNVPFLGVEGDTIAHLNGGLIILTYINLQGIYQLFSYLGTIKKIRIQNILGMSSVFVVNSIRVELWRALYIIISVILYNIIKVVYLDNRESFYSSIDCGGSKYHLSFTLQLSTFIGSVVQSCFIFILMTLGYIVTIANNLSDCDLRNMLLHLSPDSVQELPNFVEIQYKDFKQLINSQVDKNYMHLSFFPRLIKKSIFILPSYSVTDQEITKYLLHYQMENPSAFKSMIVNHPLKSINEVGINLKEDENIKLLS